MSCLWVSFGEPTIFYFFHAQAGEQTAVKLLRGETGSFTYEPECWGLHDGIAPGLYFILKNNTLGLEEHRKKKNKASWSRSSSDQKICCRPWHFGGWRGHHHAAVLTLVLYHSARVWTSQQSFDAGNHQHFSSSAICHRQKGRRNVPALEQRCPLSVCAEKQWCVGSLPLRGLTHFCWLLYDNKTEYLMHRRLLRPKHLLPFFTEQHRHIEQRVGAGQRAALLLKPRAKERRLSLSPLSYCVHRLSLSSPSINLCLSLAPFCSHSLPQSL